MTIIALAVVAAVGIITIGVLAWVAAEDRSVYHTKTYIPEERI